MATSPDVARRWPLRGAFGGDSSRRAPRGLRLQTPEVDGGEDRRVVDQGASGWPRARSLAVRFVPFGTILRPPGTAGVLAGSHSPRPRQPAMGELNERPANSPAARSSSGRTASSSRSASAPAPAATSCSTIRRPWCLWRAPPRRPRASSASTCISTSRIGRSSGGRSPHPAHLPRRRRHPGGLHGRGRLGRERPQQPVIRRVPSQGVVERRAELPGSPVPHRASGLRRLIEVGLRQWLKEAASFTGQPRACTGRLTPRGEAHHVGTHRQSPCSNHQIVGFQPQTVRCSHPRAFSCQ